MHILIDLQGAQNGSRHRGIGRYTLSFVETLCRLSLGRHRISVLLNSSFDNCDQIKERFRGYVNECDVHLWSPFGDPSFRWIGNDLRRKASEYLREAVIHEVAPDVVLLSSTIEGCDDATVTTIKKFFGDTPTAAIFYDAIPYIYPEKYLSDPREKWWYEEKIEQLVRSDLLLSISQSSRCEAIKYFDVSPKDVVSISTALSDELRRTSTQSDVQIDLAEYGISCKYILYTGASDARKNLSALIRAYYSLPAPLREQYQLVLAGGMPSEHEFHLKKVAAEADDGSGQTIFTGWVDDRTLVALYDRAHLFVFPSYHEGFGLPVLEAMHFGIPVIGSNVSSVPEVIGLKEALFDPHSVDSIASTMERALTDSKYLTRLKRNSKERSKAFSWEKTASLALSEFEERFGEVTRPRLEVPEELHVLTICALLGDDLNRLSAEWVTEVIEESLPPPNRRNKVFVDVSELHVRDSQSGIQRAVKNILKNLSDVVGDKYDVVPVYTTISDQYMVSQKVGWEIIPNYRAHPSPTPDIQPGDIFLGLDFHDVLVPLRAAAYDEMRDKGARVYFVVYDMLPLKLSKYFSSQVTLNFKKWLSTVSKLDGLVCISKSVADDVLSWAQATLLERCEPLRVGWFHLGAELKRESGAPMGREVAGAIAKFDGKPVFLSVGTLEPRKRQDQILSAFEELWAGGTAAILVLVGRRGWSTNDFISRLLNNSRMRKQLFWFEDANDSELVALMQASSALIAASEDEGFGLPLIEAAELSLPIIARDIPVFREILCDGALYFKGLAGGDLAEAIQYWLELWKRDEHPRPPAELALDWRTSTEQLVDVVFRGKWQSSFF